MRIFKIFITFFILMTTAFTQTVVTFDLDGVDDCGFVSVSGTFDSWSGWGANTDTGMAASIPAGDHEFVILCVNTEGEWWNDIWGSSTVYNAPIDGSCWNGNAEYPNYVLNVDGSGDPATVSYCAGSCDAICVGNAQDWQLVWSDEFNDPNIDMSKWDYDVGTGDWGWGNNEAQYYTYSSYNSFIEDGKLIIKAMLQNYGGANYTSARMVTKNHGDWTYGRFVVRAKMPAGLGTWPAIWMLPTDWVYGGWPYSGEIDIMEAVGFDHGTIHANAHCEIYNWWNGIPPTGGDLFVNDFNTEFHDYIIEWDENSIKWYVDDIQYHTYMNINQGSAYWPFDQDFHLLLNIAIGGTWGGQQGIDNSIFPVQMEVEYVRVYEHNEGGSDPVVTFLVDMQNEQVDEAGVYISGGDPQLAGPSGLLMSDQGNDIWTLTVPVSPGTYTYKFRNGYYDYWDGPGWENSGLLADCGVGEWNDREFTVSDNDILLGPYCFSSCEPCINDAECDNLGDINDDSFINIVDVVNIINMILNDDIIDACSDYNQDGTTNIVDIVQIVNHILEN